MVKSPQKGSVEAKHFTQSVKQEPHGAYYQVTTRSGFGHHACYQCTFVSNTRDMILTKSSSNSILKMSRRISRLVELVLNYNFLFTLNALSGYEIVSD